MKRILWAVCGLLILSGLLVAPAFCQWNAPGNVDVTGDVGWFTSLVEETNGHRHVSYYDVTNGDLKYAMWDGMNWTPETVDGTGWVGTYSSLALDAGGNVHISYYDSTNGDLKYATNSGGPWNIQAIDTAGDVGRYTAIAIDGSGDIHIVYQNSLTFMNRILKYAWFDGVWHIGIIDNNAGSGWVGAYNSLAIDGTDHIHVSYQNQSIPALMYAYGPGMWALDTVDVDPDGPGQWTDIAVDASDIPGISYMHRPSMTARNLRYAYGGLNNWSKEVVDSRDVCGDFTSITFDGLSQAMISYYGSSTGDLRFAWDSAGTWVRENVDTGGDVGRYTSISKDSMNCPRVSYYDVTNGNLKFADRQCGGVAPRHDVGVIVIVSPPTNVNGNTVYPVQATVQNFGSFTDTFMVVARIPEVTYQSVVPNVNLGPGATTTVNFMNWTTPNDSDMVCNLCVWTALGSDADLTNDTLCQPINLTVGVEFVHHAGGALWLDSGRPNPVFGRTTLTYQLPASGRVNLAIYGADGRVMRTLRDGVEDAGTKTAVWDARDDSGQPLCAGVYICRLEYGSKVLSRSLILIQ
jgi:hypothetical protein